MPPKKAPKARRARPAAGPSRPRTSAGAAAGVGRPSPLAPGFAPECMTCPLGLFLFTMRQARPEAVEHLVKAAQELFLAFRALVEQAGERVEHAQSLQRIGIR